MKGFDETFEEYLNLYDKGDYRKAYIVLSKILDNNPQYYKSGDVYLTCAQLELLVNDDIYKAKKLIDKGNKLGIRFKKDFYYNLYGYVLWRLGKRIRGIKYLEKSVELDPSITNLKNLGKVLSFENDSRAKSVWNRVLEKDPDNCMAHIGLAWDAFQSGDRDKTFLLAEKAENLASSSMDLYELARFYYEIEEYHTAITKCLKAKEAGYDQLEVYTAIVRCYISLNDADKAIEYLELIEKQDPRSNFVKAVRKEYIRKFGD